jgi:hypothetical protein
MITQLGFGLIARGLLVIPLQRQTNIRKLFISVTPYKILPF